MEEDTLTQFGFACHQLGIELKTSSIPQAKGRIERLNGTVQSRLPIELELAGINCIDEANKFLRQWLLKFNRQFGNKTNEAIYEKSPTKFEINLLLARVAQRQVVSGHHIRYQNNFYLPTEGSDDKYFTRRTKALIIEAFNGDIYVNIAEKIYTTRRLDSHERYSEEFDTIPETKKERRSIFLHSHTHGNLNLSRDTFDVLTVQSKTMRLKKQPKIKSSYSTNNGHSSASFTQ